MRKWRRRLTGVLALTMLYLQVGTPALAGSPEISSERRVWSEAKGDYVPGQLIVRFKEGRRGLAATSLLPSASVQEQRGATVLLNVHQAQVPELAAALARDPHVAYVEPNYVYLPAESAGFPKAGTSGKAGALAVHKGKSSAVTLNDPLVVDQWGLFAVDAPAAWDKLSDWSGPKATDIVVAVVDTGVDANHPDLGGRVLAGYNSLEDNQNTYDEIGHGTHVAGIIAAQAGNGEGISGVAGPEQVKILPIKALGWYGGTSLSVAAGIDKAVELGADVINLSLGGRGHSRLIEEAIQRAVDKGVLVVAAAGNEADNADGYFPARLPEAVAVAAVNESLERADFSNYGSAVDIAAPGEHVLSTMPEGEYHHDDGTSMAAPFVSGAAALVKLAHPDWQAEEIRAALEKTAADIGTIGFDADTGHGLVQVADALTFGEEAAPLRMVAPQQGAYVWGGVEIRMHVNGKSTAKVRMALADGEVLGTVPVSGGQAVYRWDTSSWDDGDYTLTALAMDATNRPIGAPVYLELKVRNEAEGSDRMQVLDPQGRPAYGASFEVWRVVAEEDGDQLNQVMSGYANSQGLIYLPRDMFLADHRYVASVRYQEDEDEDLYQVFVDLEPGMERRTIQLGATAEVEARVVSGSQPQNGSVEMIFVPLLQGVEDQWWAVFTDSDEDGVARLHLSPGRYMAYAVGMTESGESFWLRRPITLREGKESLAFDLTAAKPLEVNLPDWVDHGRWYPGVRHLFVPGVYVQSGSRVHVTPDEVDSYWLDLYKWSDDQVWVYELSREKALDLAEADTLKVPAKAAVKRLNTDDIEAGSPYEPGDWVELPLQLAFGENLVLDELEVYDAGWWEEYMPFPAANSHPLALKYRGTGQTVVPDGSSGLLSAASVKEDEPEDAADRGEQETGPQIVLTDRDGDEVWRTFGLYDFEVPDADELESGSYRVKVDFRRAPFPVSIKERKVGTIDVAAESPEADEVEMTVIAPEDVPFEEADVTVMDPDTREVVEWSYASREEDEPFTIRFEEVQPDREYLFRLNGILQDGTPVLVQRWIEVSRDEILLDLSEDRPHHLDVPLSEGSYAVLIGDRGQLEWFRLDSWTDEVWMDPGRYEFFVVEKKDNGLYVYRDQVKVSSRTDTLNLNARGEDFRQVMLETDGFAEVEYQLGVMPESGEALPELFLFELLPLTAEDPVYLSEDEFDLVLQEWKERDDTSIVTTMMVERRRDGRDWQIKADGTWRVRLKPDEKFHEPGDTMDVDVRVTDRNGNRLIGVTIIPTDPGEHLSVPLRLEQNQQGKRVWYAYSAEQMRYVPLGWQEVMPTVSWKLDGKTVMRGQSEEYWHTYGLQVPDTLEPGRYELRWSVSTHDLSARTTITIRE